MKKCVSLIIVSAILLLMAACGSNDGSSGSSAVQKPATEVGSAVSGADAQEPADNPESLDTPEADVAVESVEMVESEPGPVAQDPATVTVIVGGVSLAFDREGEFYDLAYKFPSAMELEKDEEGGRDLVKYYADGYDPWAFAAEVTRLQGYSIEEIVEGILRFETTTEVKEYNGIAWTVGTVEVDNDAGNITRTTIYVSVIGDYEYILRFTSPCANLYDFADFANVFAQNATMN